jgi:MFS family permease
MKVSQKWIVAAVVMVGPTLAIMDSTIVSVILSQLQTAFHTDFQTISWVASAYFLAQAAVLPIIGYVSDRVGTKIAFMASLALFTAGSLLCSLSPTPEALIAFRVLQGIGGGALLPLLLAINFRNFPPNECSKVSAILGIPIILAPTFGPTIGGYLSTSLNWNAVFLINVPLGIIDLLLTFLILPGRTSNQNEQAKGARKSFDILGLVLSLVGVTTLVYGISEAGTQGWGDQTVLTSLLIGAAVLIVFVVVELRVSDPVLDLRLFLNYTFTMGRDPAIEVIKKAQQAKASETAAIEQVQEGRDERPAEHLLAPQPLPVLTAPIKSIPNVISTLTTNGEEVMGPEILLWHYPEDNVVNGSLLTVESNQFCVLKSYGAILEIYETGQYTVQTPLSPLYDSVQLAFSGEPIPWQYEVLYINRAKLMGKASGVVLSREMAEVDYHVDYAFHVATCEDAMRLVQHMPYRGHTLSMQEVSAYAGPVIEEAVNQLVLITPLGQAQGLQMMQDISQLVHQRLQLLLSGYGMTLDMVKVQGLRPRDEHIKALISLKAFGLSDLDAVRYYIAMMQNSMDRRVREQHQELEQNLSMIWRETLDRYADEIAALQAELESTRADIGLRMDAHSAHLQKLSHAISNDLRTSAPPLERHHPLARIAPAIRA